MRKIYLYIYEKAIERDGKKWEMVCKARSDAAKAKHAKEEISAKAAKATDKDKEKDKEKEKEYDYVYDKEKEKERSAPNNRTSKEKLLAEYSSRHKRGRGFERRGGKERVSTNIKSTKGEVSISCFLLLVFLLLTPTH